MMPINLFMLPVNKIGKPKRGLLPDGNVIGAIGASFDTPEHDVQIARAGLGEGVLNEV